MGVVCQAAGHSRCAPGPVHDARTRPPQGCSGAWDRGGEPRCGETGLTLKILALLAAIYCFFVGLVYLTQERLIFLPSRVLAATPALAGLDHKDLLLRTRDGVVLHAWLVPAPTPRATVLFLHGNGGNISHRIQTLAMLHRLGLSTLILDYRGYGRSSGRPTEPGTYEDARTAWRYLTEQRGFEPGAIIVMGRSLGGAVAAFLAREVEPAALILESSFTSMAELARHHYPYLPVEWLLRSHYPTLDRLRGVQVPALVIHSRHDEIIPFAHGQRLFRALSGEKRFLAIDGGHNDAFLRSAAAYRLAIDRFVSEVVAPAPATP